MSAQSCNRDSEISHCGQHILKLKELRESIHLCSDYTQKQIQNIDKKNLIYTTVTMIISICAVFGWGTISGYLKIFVIYWIPASFSLWFLWWIYGIVSLVHHFRQRKYAPPIQSDQPSENGKKMIVDEWLNKSLKPPFIGIAFIYSLTLIFLLIASTYLNLQPLPIIPLITSIFFVISPFILKINSEDLKRKDNVWMVIVATIIGLLLVVVLPFFALLDSFRIIPNLFSMGSIEQFVFVLGVQIFLILVFISSISGIIAEFEMNKLLNGLSKINDEINELLLDENAITEEKVGILIQQYHMTKKYDVDVIKLFIFKTYTLSPNKVFLKKC